MKLWLARTSAGTSLRGPHDIVVRDPPELGEFVEAGQLSGTDLYVHPSWEFDLGSPAEDHQLNTAQLHDFMRGMREAYRKQECRSRREGEKLLAEIYCEMSEEVAQSYAVGTVAGHRCLWVQVCA